MSDISCVMGMFSYQNQGEERQMSDSGQKSDTSRVFDVYLVKNDKYKYLLFKKPLFTHSCSFKCYHLLEPRGL